MQKTVENIYIYISDSLRYDKLLDKTEYSDNVIKTIAGSTFTASSIPTILTGTYPPQHGVWTFSDMINPEISTVFDLIDADAAGYFAHKYVSDLHHGVTHAENNIYDFFTDVQSLESPFIVFDRDNLPHLPYGMDHASGFERVDKEFGYDMAPSSIFTDNSEGISGDSLTAGEYLNRRDTDMLEIDYIQAVEESIERFESRLNILQDMGKLENTLVIFTADHGEELGEYGLYNHGNSPVPETIYVPTLFYYDGEPIEFERDFMSHIDILPTIGDLLEVDLPEPKPGYSLSENVTRNRMTFSAIRTSWYTGTEFIEWGVWDSNGGHTFSNKSRVQILLSAVYNLINNYSTDFYRNNAIDIVLEEFYRRDREFGNPQFTRSEAKKFRDNLPEMKPNRASRQLDEETKQHLRELGYRDNVIDRN